MLNDGSTLKDIYLSHDPTLIFDDDPDTIDIFVWLAQEISKQIITSGTGLQKVTGLDSEPLDDMQNIFISAMTCRLETALVYAIRSGLKYKELKQININDFHLPEQWLDIDSDIFINKMAVIRLSIAKTHGLAEHSKRRKSLQIIADDLEAPI